jgi:hypothetical protein
VRRVGRIVVLDILSEGAQRRPRRDKPEAGGGYVGERHKQERHHENVNDDCLKRDGAALIRDERIFMAHEPTSTDTYRVPVVDQTYSKI